MMEEQNLFDEKALLLRIADGDEEAFTQLYRSYVPRLASFLQGLTHSAALTDELVQETFLQIWLNRDRLPAVENPKAWVFRIAANITYTFLRRQVKEREVLGKISSGPFSYEMTTEGNLHVQELRKVIKEAVEQLSPQRKKVYRLSREGGLTIPEIAEKLALSSSTVKNTLVAALQQIREYIQQKGFDISWVLLWLFFF